MILTNLKTASTRILFKKLKKHDDADQMILKSSHLLILVLLKSLALALLERARAHECNQRDNYFTYVNN